jgi:hypothetical protein
MHLFNTQVVDDSASSTPPSRQQRNLQEELV